MPSLKVKEVRDIINNALDELDEPANISVEQYFNTELIELTSDIIAPINELLDLSCSDWKLFALGSVIGGKAVYFDLFNENMGVGVEMVFKSTLTLSTVLPILFTLR